MKRVPLQRGDKPLERRTALKPGVPLQRKTEMPRNATPLPRQGALDSSGDTGKAKAPRQRQGRDTGPSAAVRALVVARDGDTCVVGVTCQREPDRPLVINHRINRGMGGSTDPAVNAPSVLIRCCNPCNLWLEDHPDVAYEYGWKVRRPGVPSEVPILYPDYRWYLLRDDGGRDGFPHSAHDD